MAASRGLYRSRKHRIVAGVAGGLAERFGVPVWLMRLIWLALLLPGGLPGLVPYLVLWAIVPLEPEE
ncbi:MAG: PspC domain-containing protein [Thermomicrobiaceae bacterium]|nr:PspC domain-containing protein [Thermomicrobiaceae bacterium]